MIPVEHYLALSLVLFVIGAGGALLRRNPIIILMSIGVMLTAVNVNLIAFSRLWGATQGQAFSLFIMADAAAETALGLGILVAFSRARRAEPKESEPAQPVREMFSIQAPSADEEETEIPAERSVL